MKEYVIKYAAMPIYDKYDTECILGYVAMQCYLVGQEKKELPPSGEIYYYVVFKKKYTNLLNEKNKNEKPKYKRSKEYVNATIVDAVFDTFEEAKEYRNKLNNIIKYNALCSLENPSLTYAVREDNLKNRFERFYDLEEKEEVKMRTLNKN